MTEIRARRPGQVGLHPQPDPTRAQDRSPLYRSTNWLPKPTFIRDTPSDPIPRCANASPTLFTLRSAEHHHQARWPPSLERQSQRVSTPNQTSQVVHSA